MKSIRTPFPDDDREIELLIDAFAAEPNGGVILLPPSPTAASASTILRRAALHKLPTVFDARQYVADGALLSYGPDYNDLWRRACTDYVDRILRGAKPGDLPVQFPTKFELAINLRTAKAIGLDIPWIMQQRADEIIE